MRVMRIFRGHMEVWHEDMPEEEGPPNERRRKRCLVFKYTLGFGILSRNVMVTLSRGTLRFPYVAGSGSEITGVPSFVYARPRGKDRGSASSAGASAPTTDEFPPSNSPGPGSSADLEDGIHSADWVENVGDRVIDPLLGEYKVSALFRHRSSRGGRLELPAGELRFLMRSAAVTVFWSWTVLESGSVRQEWVSYSTSSMQPLCSTVFVLEEVAKTDPCVTGTAVEMRN